MSVSSCYKPLESSDSKTKCLNTASTLFSPLEHHRALHSKQQFSTPGDLRVPQVPCKTTVFSRGRFSWTKRTIPFPWHRGRAGSCPMHLTQAYPVPQRTVLLLVLLQPCWSAWNPGPQHSTTKDQTLETTLSRTYRACLDCKLGLSVFSQTCI